MRADFHGVNTPPWSILSQSTQPLTLAVGRETQVSSQGEVRQPPTLCSTHQVSELFRTQHPCPQEGLQTPQPGKLPQLRLFLPLSSPRFRSQGSGHFHTRPSLTRQPPCPVLLHSVLPDDGSAWLVPISLPHLRADLAGGSAVPSTTPGMEQGALKSCGEQK